MKHGRKSPDQIKAEGFKYLAEAKTRGEVLMEKWSKNEIGYGLVDMYATTPHKARLVASLLENQERHLKRMDETTITSEFAVRPEHVLKVVRIGSANSVRSEIITEVALQSTDDALYYLNLNYASTKRDATAGNFIYSAANRFYASEQDKEDITAAASDQQTITCSTTPLIVNKVFCQLDNRLIGYDDGNGVITPVVSTIAGIVNLKVTGITATFQTVDYATGVVKLEFDSALAGTETVSVVYNFNSEDPSNYSEFGEVTLSIEKKRFEARQHPLGYSYSMLSEVMLGTTAGKDLEDLLITGVGDEHAKAKDYRCIGLLKSIALKNTQFTFDCDFGKAGEVSANSHAQNLLGKINLVGAEIYNDLKRGKANKAIVGTNAYVYLQKHNMWKEDTAMNRVGVYKAGSLGDIDVYVCPADSAYVTADELLLTYKNPEEVFDISIAIGVLTELTASLVYPNLYKKGTVASVEDQIIVNNKFVRLLSLSNFSVGG